MPFTRALIESPVRVGDVIPHEVANKGIVNKMVAHLRAGGSLPSIHVDMTWKEHWTQGPTGMVSTGWGYGLLDGHHRLEAYEIVFGKDYMASAVSYTETQDKSTSVKRPRM